MSTITTIDKPPSSHELWRAYRDAGLHKLGVTLIKAINTPSINKSLTLLVDAKRKKNGAHAPNVRGRQEPRITYEVRQLSA